MEIKDSVRNSILAIDPEKADAKHFKQESLIFIPMASVPVRSITNVIFFLIQHDDQVSGFQLGLLVALAAEHDLLPVRHALVQVNFQDLPVAYCLASLLYKL